MFAFLKGELVEATASEVILNVGGVGYLLFTPIHLLARLPQIGSTLTLYTHLIVREDAHTLYGFLTQEEKMLFLRFLSIQGVGPKTALSLVGHSEAIDLVSAIMQNNASVLCKVPGVGKKTAERIILEVKDKMPRQLGGPQQNLQFDAMNALMNLGYSRAIAEKAVRYSLEKAKSQDLSSLITHALNHCK